MRTLIGAIAIAVLSASAASAQPMEPPLAMENLAEKGPGPVVIGGQPASVADWPSTLIFRTKVGFCTSTAIGGRVILTAAHCVDDGAKGVVKVGTKSVTIACRHHQDYAKDYRIDVAICAANEDVPTPNYERLNTSLNVPKLGDKVRLIGYGCRQPGGGGPSESLYEGDATVSELPVSGSAYTITVGGAAVCFGDSGGGAYLIDGALRFVMGVNSRGDILTRSLLTTVAHKSVIDFIKAEAAKVSSKICGVDNDAQRCRG